MKKRHSIFLILVFSLFIVLGYGWEIAGSGEYPKPGPRPQPKPSSPTPDKQTDFGFSCTLSINETSPREIFTSSSKITASYNLLCRSPLNVSTIPIKVGLFIDNQLKESQEINNFPNNQTRRLFIETESPRNPGNYNITLKALRPDVDPARASGSQIYAQASTRIQVNPEADLVILGSEINIQPGEPFVDEEFWVEVPVKYIGVERVLDVELSFTLLKGGRVIINKLHTAPVISPNIMFTFNASLVTGELGEHEIRIAADPNNKIKESNKTNNNFSRSLTVIAAEKIVRSQPSDRETGIDIIPEINAVFNKSIGEATVSAQPSFRLREKIMGGKIIITPLEILNPGTTYTIRIHVVGGHTHTFQFTTVEAENILVRVQNYHTNCHLPGIAPGGYVTGDYEGIAQEQDDRAFCKPLELQFYFSNDLLNAFKKRKLLSAKLHMGATNIRGNPFTDLGELIAIVHWCTKTTRLILPRDPTIDLDVTQLIKSFDCPQLNFEISFQKDRDNDNENDHVVFGIWLDVKYVRDGKYKLF